eukprot:958620-Pyramimonas_sp.AAC.1
MGSELDNLHRGRRAGSDQGYVESFGRHFGGDGFVLPEVQLRGFLGVRGGGRRGCEVVDEAS